VCFETLIPRAAEAPSHRQAAGIDSSEARVREEEER